jgi:eukaryotic-like serine/threonine-protein kinase
MRVHLRVIEGPGRGKAFTFETRDRFLIGRAPDVHFQLVEDPYFSRHHALFEVNPPNVLLQDLKSTNGTYVNNQRITGSKLLAHGDTISGGTSRLQFVIEEVALDVTDPPRFAFAPLPPPMQLAEDKLPVKCLRCDTIAVNELPRARAEEMIYFCDRCQAALIAEPQLVPGYQVVKELGRGGMGAVYLAVHKILGRRAIKMILPRVAISKDVRELFVREASTHALLDHPRVVRVLDFQEPTPGIFCMVMDYVDGTNADDLLREQPGGLPLDVAIEIVSQGLEGLAHAHDKGLVHRDIKGANLLVARDKKGRLGVKLSDFGLAKSYETSGVSGFTKSGDVSGTVPYMAPEQVLDFKNVKPPADLYSMGATLYFLLTGQLAYRFKPNVEPLVTIIEDPIVPIRERKATIPVKVAEVVERAMRKDPAQRYHTADEMREALRTAVSA